MKNRIGQDHWLLSRPIAHRGLHDKKVPENSLAAFQRAINKNMPIELDVQLTADDEVVVFHDRNLQRMTGLNQKVKNTKLNEIRQLKLLKTKETIPTLAEVLQVVRCQVPLLIEIKSRYGHGRIEPAVVKILNRYSGKFAVQSFNPRTVRWFYKNRPDLICGLVAGTLEGQPTNPIQRFIGAKLLLAPLAHPQFIAYDVQAAFKPYFRFIARVWGGPILVWVVKNRPVQNQAQKLGWGAIIE